MKLIPNGPPTGYFRYEIGIIKLSNKKLALYYTGAQLGGTGGVNPPRQWCMDYSIFQSSPCSGVDRGKVGRCKDQRYSIIYRD